MGLEIVEQVPDVDAVLVPIGGGGLIAGTALAVKSLHPNVKIYVSISCVSRDGLRSKLLTKCKIKDRHCISDCLKNFVWNLFMKKTAFRPTACVHL
jgi:threonine dehydratase